MENGEFEFSIHHSSFLHFFILHSSFFILHSSFFILHSSFFILHSPFTIHSLRSPGNLSSIIALHSLFAYNGG